MFHSPSQNEAPRTVNRLLLTALACILIWMFASMLAPSIAIAQDVHARSVLTTTEIVEAMQDNQLPTRGVQVRLSVPITAAVAHPPLEIQAIAPLNQHDVRLRMSCQDRSACLPFFATATYSEAINPAAFQTSPIHQSTGTPERLPVAKPIAEVLAPSNLVQSLNSSAAPVLRSGSPATLDFDGERIHVRIEVICLESGATGDKIRVTTRDRKQVYVAEIVAPNALKGTLTR